MSSIENVRKESSGAKWFVVGAILLILGIMGIIRYATEGINTPLEGSGTPDGAYQGLLIVGSGLCTGVGLLLIVLGALKRRRSRAQR